MRAARFVTLSFIYCGVIFLVQYVAFYGFSFAPLGLVNLGVGVSVLAVGVYRLWNSAAEDQHPAKYGLFAYGMAALSVVLTLILFAAVLV